MKKIFIINGGQSFGHSGGQFNHTVSRETAAFFQDQPGYEVQLTDVSSAYDPDEEVKKYLWADVIIYHFPVWWFSLPHDLKKYIDVVFTAGHDKGLYTSDGRSSRNPDINYGTGGTLKGRQYMFTSSWNAPAAAFTLPGEFFQERSVDDGVLFGFHRMNAFLGLSPLETFHFHDVEKNADVPRDMKLYKAHLQAVFATEAVATA
ncbi:NAD(P)H-dependent oxidoreductase [Chitinophaga sp. Cy-1792]|uniref:NAD(P)H-dependent oxidoreductase n=1 Tax=Chitinophaga sp. Cy-1792 TaxID=2608339 RepID=UPI00142098F0|nr:NAD(P)H-dependent oxidoreductase [Chitinophaga sp. Cy-1792]NIG55981.1 NADPH quinone reductase MdaB [Chitinophaga sp. Cy-1792]